MKISVPRIDPKTGRPALKKINHRTFGTCYQFAEYDRVEQGSEPERERWNDRLAELARALIAEEAAHGSIS
jgi:hypothetical protein